MVLLGLLDVGDYIFYAILFYFTMKEGQAFDHIINGDGYKTFSGGEGCYLLTTTHWPSKSNIIPQSDIFITPNNLCII